MPARHDSEHMNSDYNEETTHMNDLAQHAEGNSKSEPELTNPSSKLLKFSGVHPRKIYVKDFGNSSGHLPGFALHESLTYYTGGIHWEFPIGTETALFVTFKFVTDISGVDCDGLQYSAVYGDSVDHQDLCAPALQSEYNFTVSFSDGGSHDPRIVVTPVSTDPDA
jgi:hypothetical protein